MEKEFKFLVSKKEYEMLTKTRIFEDTDFSKYLKTYNEWNEHKKTLSNINVNKKSVPKL